MLALCLMLLVTYYVLNYAGIISRGLVTQHNSYTNTACIYYTYVLVLELILPMLRLNQTTGPNTE